MASAFDPNAIERRLRAFPASLRALVSSLSREDCSWKPQPEHWSILEVCCHLLDEEREDFKVRIERVLNDPEWEWPPLDLNQVAQRRRYGDRDITEVLCAFEAERARSMAWLHSLPAPIDWGRARIHPEFGPLAAGMLLASWAAHDALHLRQIAKRLHGLAARDAGPYSIEYAGEW